MEGTVSFKEELGNIPSNAVTYARPGILNVNTAARTHPDTACVVPHSTYDSLEASVTYCVP